MQIGAQSTDFVMLFMNKDGLNSLLSDQFTLVGDASVAAGPVGRQAGAATDLKLNAQILSYSRSKGLVAGLELKGVVIKPDKDDMRDVYGEGVTAKEVLKENKVTIASSRAAQITFDADGREQTEQQEVATKRLADHPDLASVSAVIREGRAILAGSVNSAAIKVKAEHLVKAVLGVKSVDNQIVFPTQ